MKTLLFLLPVVALVGCANQIGATGQRAIGEVAQFNDTMSAAAVRAPCIMPLGSIVRQYSPAERSMIMMWGDTFCHAPAATAPAALPSLPLGAVPLP